MDVPRRRQGARRGEGPDARVRGRVEELRPRDRRGAVVAAGDEDLSPRKERGRVSLSHRRHATRRREGADAAVRRRIEDLRGGHLGCVVAARDEDLAARQERRRVARPSRDQRPGRREEAGPGVEDLGRSGPSSASRSTDDQDLPGREERGRKAVAGEAQGPRRREGSGCRVVELSGRHGGAPPHDQDLAAPEEDRRMLRPRHHQGTGERGRPGRRVVEFGAARRPGTASSGDQDLSALEERGGVVGAGDQKIPDRREGRGVRGEGDEENDGPDQAGLHLPEHSGSNSLLVHVSHPFSTGKAKRLPFRVSLAYAKVIPGGRAFTHTSFSCRRGRVLSG